MKKDETAITNKPSGGGKQKNRRLRIAAAALAAVLLAVCILLAVNALVYPLRYLWVLFGKVSVPPRQEGELRVHFLDVGQGDCAVIEFPDGKTMIVDGGDETRASRQTVLRYIRALGIEKFDFLLLTHTDGDHAGGLDDVLALYGADTAFVPYCTRPSINDSYSDFTRALSESGSKAEISHLYTHVLSDTPENFYYLTFLSPLSPGLEGSFYDKANADGATAEDINDASAVFWLEYAGRSILFTGDITSRAEEFLLSAYTDLGAEAFGQTVSAPWGEKIRLAPELEDLDFLKVAHHGSAQSSSEEFLRMTAPEAAFVSAGTGNGYGHPSAETLSRLSAAGAEIFRTDESGTILLTIGKDGSYTVEYT